MCAWGAHGEAHGSQNREGDQPRGLGGRGVSEWAGYGGRKVPREPGLEIHDGHVHVWELHEIVSWYMYYIHHIYESLHAYLSKYNIIYILYIYSIL